MDSETTDRFAIRCILVSTQSGMSKIARAHRHDPDTRDRLQAATRQRGNALLTELERRQPLSRRLLPDMRAARAALADPADRPRGSGMTTHAGRGALGTGPGRRA